MNCWHCNHEHEEYLERKYEDILELKVGDFIDSVPEELQVKIIDLIQESIE